MSDYIREYEFKELPKSIKYSDGEPLNLTEEYIFYHNKLIIRDQLTRLQNLFVSYFKKTLLASGIRDSYLKEELSRNYLFIIFTKADALPKMNDIIEQYKVENPEPGCFFMVNNSAFILILAKDKKGATLGLDYLEQILEQTLDDYFKQKKFDDFIKIRPLEIKSCKKE